MPRWITGLLAFAFAVRLGWQFGLGRYISKFVKLIKGVEYNVTEGTEATETLLQEDITKKEFERHLQDVYNVSSILEFIHQQEIKNLLTFKYPDMRVPQLEKNDIFCYNTMLVKHYGLVIDSTADRLEIVWEVEEALEPPAPTGPGINYFKVEYDKRYERTVTNQLIQFDHNWIHFSYKKYGKHLYPATTESQEEKR